MEPIQTTEALTSESHWTLVRNKSLHGLDIKDTRSNIRGQITEEVSSLYHATAILLRITVMVAAGIAKIVPVG